MRNASENMKVLAKQVKGQFAVLEIRKVGDPRRQQEVYASAQSVKAVDQDIEAFMKEMDGEHHSSPFRNSVTGGGAVEVVMSPRSAGYHN